MPLRHFKGPIGHMQTAFETLQEQLKHFNIGKEVKLCSVSFLVTSTAHRSWAQARVEDGGRAGAEAKPDSIPDP